MERIPVSKLRDYDTELDIFSGTKPIELGSQVIRLGLHPPVVLNGKRIVWGFPLLAAAGDEGDLPCANTEGGPMEDLILALTLEDRTNRYSFREKARILSYLKAHSLLSGRGPGKDISQVEALVQEEGSFIPSAESFSGLSPAAADAVDRGLIDLKTAAAFPLNEETASLLFAAELSLSERRIAYRLISEMTSSSRLPLEKERELAELAVREGTRALRRIRFPELTGLEEELSRIRASYLAGSGITLSPPQNFEGDRFTFSFSCGSVKQLKKIIAALNRIGENFGELENLLHDPL